MSLPRSKYTPSENVWRKRHARAQHQASSPQAPKIMYTFHVHSQRPRHSPVHAYSSCVCTQSWLNYSRSPISLDPISFLLPSFPPNAVGMWCLKQFFRTQGQVGSLNPEKEKCKWCKRDQDSWIFILFSLMMETRLMESLLSPISAEFLRAVMAHISSFCPNTDCNVGFLPPRTAGYTGACVRKSSATCTFKICAHPVMYLDLNFKK